MPEGALRPMGTALLIGLALSAAPAGAEVRVEVLADGTRVIRNDGWRPRSPTRPPRRAVEPIDLGPIIERQSDLNGLDPELVRAVIRVESGYDPLALSRKGAMGLMQLMPATARSLAVRDPYDPAENVRAGAAYLRRMLDVFDGDTQLALAGYNAGPEAVRRFGGIPPYPETLSYVESVLRLYRRDPGFSLAGSPQLRIGRKTHLYRDAQGRLVMSTTPPAGR